MHATTAHPALTVVRPRPATVVLGLVLLLVGAAPASGESGDPVGVWPLRPAPVVVRGFDAPSSTWGAGHRGADLLGRPGEPVRAALDGVVSFAGVIAGRGVVVVDHGGTRTTYEPIVASAKLGTRLRAGDLLGTLALTGSHCLPRTCLHWGWLRGSTYLDPLRLVGAGPVRLLPITGGTPAEPVLPAPALPYAGWLPLIQLFR